jgi:lipoyl(octanoyl) transferase
VNDDSPLGSDPIDAHSDYPIADWRLLNTGYADGATNMAVDEAIMRAVSEKLVPPTLRFYGWQPPCVSLGYSQSIAEIDLERCQRDGVDWVRRATGGRAILHTDELTYSIATPLDDPRAAGGVVESYRHLSHGLVAGLAALQLDVVQADYQDRTSQKYALSAACFDIPSHYEVTVNGRKLIGSAQTRRLGTLLQHGTLPLVGDVTRLIDYLNLPSSAERSALREKLAARAATLEAVLGRVVTLDEAGRAITEGFERALRLRLTAGALTSQEQAWAVEFKAGRYGDAAWNAQR